MLQYNPSISGSLNITGSLIISNGMIGTVNGVDVQIFSSSINQVITGIQSATGSQDRRLGSIESFTSSTSARLNSIETISASNLSRINSIETITASNIARLNSIEIITSSNVARLNSIEIVSASNIARINSLETTSASVNTLNTTQNTRLTNLENTTGSLATTGSNTFIGTQVFSGSLFVQNNLVVQGSSSLQNITASAVSIGTNTVLLNTSNPSVRFAGISAIDSGSASGKSGSLYFDSTDNEWVFVHQGNTAVTSSIMITGPETYDSLGNETRLTTNSIPKSTNNFHIVDSCITDNGTTVCVNATLKASGQVCGVMGNFSCIGTNTSTPGYTLDIQSPNGYAANFQQTTPSTYGAIRITGNGRGGELDFYSGSTMLGSIWADSSISGNIHIGTGASATERMFICGNNGYVGIGTSTPTALLHVSGTPGQNNPSIRLTDSAATGNGGNVFISADKQGVGYNNLTTIAFSHTLKGGASASNYLTIDANGISTFTCQLCALQFRGYNYGVAPQGAFRGGLYVCNQVSGTGTDCSLMLFSEGGANGGNFYIATGGSADVKFAMDGNGLSCFRCTLSVPSLTTFGGGLNENFAGTGGGHINRYFAVKYMPENQTTAFFKITTSGASATYINLVGTNAGVGWYSSQVYHAANSAYWGGWIGGGTQISMIGTSAGYITGTHSDGAGGQTFCVLVGNNGTGTSSLIFAYITTVTFAGYSTSFTQL